MWWPRLRLLLLVAVFLAAAWLGVKEGFDGLRDASTTGQRLAAGFQVLYGAAALVGAPWRSAIFAGLTAAVLAGFVCWAAWAHVRSAPPPRTP